MNRVKYITYYFIPPSSHIDGPIEDYIPDNSPIEINVEFENGEIANTITRPSRCESCKLGFYQIYDYGDIEGYENRCSNCGARVWGPIYCGYNLNCEGKKNEN